MSETGRQDPGLVGTMGDRAVESASAQVDQDRQALDDQARAAADHMADLVGALSMTQPPQEAEASPGSGGEWFAAVLNSVLSGVVMVDPQTHRIVGVNTMAARLIGLPKDQIVGQDCRTLICAAEHSQCPVTDLGQCVNLSEQVLVRKGGAVRLPVIKTVTEVPWQGRTYLVESFIDISAWKQAHQQLENANKELTEFAYVVSHDLRAPLRGIKTLAGWIASDQGDRLDKAGHEQLSLLLSRVTRMEDLINGILQYSRAGRPSDKDQRADLAELVPAIIDMIAPPAHVTITLETPLPQVEGDKTRLAQVFQNLLSNAVKFIDKPQGLIRVACLDEGPFWRFSVSDNGPGIEEKYFDRIFKLFQTLTPKDESESSGVGLAVVKKIVTFYGGKVWVESKVGEGSTFFFTLPKLRDTGQPGPGPGPSNPS